MESESWKVKKREKPRRRYWENSKKTLKRSLKEKLKENPNKRDWEKPIKIK